MCNRSRSAICGLLAITVGSLTLSARPEEKPLERLDVQLTIAPGLPEGARVSLMKEAAGIWRNHGVSIDWLPATAVRPISRNRLRVLVVERRQAPLNPDEAFSVGELLRPANGHPIAMMSIESARRLVASVRGRAGYDLAVVDDRRLGLVLGRALAHEIGHYLLGTHTHARHGLMRPQFNALEFTDLRDGTFALDRTASDWLKSHLNLSATSMPAAKHSGFAYAH